MDSITSSLISLPAPADLDTYSILPTPEPSMLLSLPHELRSQIWEEYFGRRLLDLRLYCNARNLADGSIKLFGATGAAQNAEFKNHNSELTPFQEDGLIYIGRLRQKPPTCYNRFYEVRRPEPTGELLPLLCTNRQIHEEAMRVLFKRRVWLIEDGELPLWLDCGQDHTSRNCMNLRYHNVHLTLQSHLPPSGNDSYGFYSTIFVSLTNLQFLWNMHIEIELVDQRDMHLIDWICKTLSKTLEIPAVHTQDITIVMRYQGQRLPPRYRQEIWPLCHRREFIDTTWMRFQQPGLAIAAATHASQQERLVGRRYVTLKDRATLTLISPINNEHKDRNDAPITRVCMGRGDILWQNRFDRPVSVHELGD